MKFTFLCDWANPEIATRDTKFVVVVQAESHRQAVIKAASAALARYPDIAEFESPRTFWEGEFGAKRVAEFRGDVSGSLIDREDYDHITA
ncbi:MULTISPECIES: hypothetical protein [Streptomyces]|uniref:Uncharacterized protein n=2 Tax=Streptomyces TaxID=1883 RepID=A0ABU4JYU0_9ACTN|nr:hypothetical protein [Streptomyces roseolus]MDX2290664.1 hypothetical protein [Streptomyces roseolus]